MTLALKTQPVPLTINKDEVILVTGTRIPLDTIIYAFHNGDSAEAIVEQYDVLKLADVYAVISYYLNHQEEVDAYIRQREKEAEVIRRENQARFPAHALRERLLARRNKDVEIRSG